MRDITELCCDVARGLEVNELLHGPSFNLFEAMSALELMDPKMDGDHEPTVDVATRVATGALRFELSSAELSAVLERLLVCLVSWFDGGSLAETLFTCLYLHQPALAHLHLLREQAGAAASSSLIALLAAVTTVLRTVGLQRKAVIQADIYEEEDFCPGLFGFATAPDVSDDAMRALCAEAEERAAQDGASDRTAADRLLPLLRWFRALHDACATLADVRKGSVESGANEAREAIRDATKQLAAIEAQHGGSGSAPPPDLALHGFDASINRPLLGSAPMRKVHFDAFPEVLAKLGAFLGTLDGICTMLLSPSLDALRGTLKRLSKASANVLARSLMAMNLYVDDLLLGRLVFYDVVREAMVDDGVAAVVLSSQAGSDFMHHVIKPVYDSLRLFTLNRSRQRARLELLFHDWAIVQNEARYADGLFCEEVGLECAQYLSNWALMEVLGMMQQHVSLGIELQLYSCHECDAACAYWYWEYLISASLHVLTAVMSSKEELERLKEMDKDKEKRRGGLVATGKKRSNKHKKKPGPGEPSNGASPGVGHELNLQLHVRRSLCRGIARLLAGVSASHLLQHQEAEAIFEYSSWRCRFEHRFAAFANLQQPPVLRFGEFENTMSGDPQALLASAAECFKQCKSLIDRAVRAMPEPDETALAELRNLTKVAVANGVTIAQFQAGAPADSGRRRIELHYDAHALFPRVVAK